MNLHLSPWGQEPDDVNLKHSSLPWTPSPCFCRLFEASYRQYCVSILIELRFEDSLASFGTCIASMSLYGDRVVFGGFAPISAADMVDDGVGDMA
jgi:hypothetical protein